MNYGYGAQGTTILSPSSVDDALNAQNYYSSQQQQQQQHQHYTQAQYAQPQYLQQQQENFGGANQPSFLGGIHIGVFGFIIFFFLVLIIFSLLFIPGSGILLTVLALLFLTLAIVFNAQASTFLAAFFVILFLVILLAFLVFAFFKGATVRLWWANVRAAVFESCKIYPGSLGGDACDDTEIVAAYNDWRVLERRDISGNGKAALITQHLNRFAPGGHRQENVMTLHKGE